MLDQLKKLGYEGVDKLEAPKTAPEPPPTAGARKEAQSKFQEACQQLRSAAAQEVRLLGVIAALEEKLRAKTTEHGKIKDKRA